MEKKGVKFRASQGLHTIMKAYQFTEDAVNKIRLQRCVMFHILYDSCVYCTNLMSWNSRGEEAGRGGGGEEVLRVQ
jgi:hypothetical protein